jgi:hypothetical protein
MVVGAAPGGEGLVVNLFSPEAPGPTPAVHVAFARFPAGLVRRQFHDSFKALRERARAARCVKEMHGYDIQDYGAELMDRKH